MLFKIISISLLNYEGQQCPTLTLIGADSKVEGGLYKTVFAGFNPYLAAVSEGLSEEAEKVSLEGEGEGEGVGRIAGGSFHLFCLVPLPSPLPPLPLPLPLSDAKMVHYFLKVYNKMNKININKKKKKKSK